MLWNMTQKPEIYTRAEVADMLKVSISTVGRLIKDRELYAFKAGRGVRVPAYSLAAYVAGEAPPHWTPDAEPDTSTWPPTPSLFDDGHGPEHRKVSDIRQNVSTGHSRAMRRMSDEPEVKPGINPYPTRTEDGAA